MGKYDKGWREVNQIHMFPVELTLFDRWHITFLKGMLHLMEFERWCGRGTMNPRYLAQLSVDIEGMKTSIFRLEAGI